MEQITTALSSAHHLHLVFLPAENRLFDEHLAHRREIEATLHLLVELLAVERDAGAGAAECEAGTDHRGQADLREHLAGLGKRLHDPPATGLEADLPHRLLEDLAVLAATDRLGPGTDHLDAMLCQHAVPLQLQGEVEGRLAAERGEHGVGLLDLDHLLEHLPGERFDVGAVGRTWIGHDRGRVRIHQHDAVAVLAKRLAGLSARVVEFAGLPDNNGTGPDQQNRVEIVAAGHGKT
jgi:hypothetical protein